jgi:hypothetical protein
MGRQLMNNKVLVKLIIPEIDGEYDVFIPINLRIGTIIKLLNESLKELNQGMFSVDDKKMLYNRDNAEPYNFNDLVRNTNIRNGSVVIFV